MLDAFLEVLVEKEARHSKREEMADTFMALPTDELHKIASGALKLADYDDHEWLTKFKGTPLYEPALQLEQQCLELDIQQQQSQQARSQESQQDRAIWDAKDGIRLKKRMLDLELLKMEGSAAAGGNIVAGAPPAPDMQQEQAAAQPNPQGVAGAPMEGAPKQASVKTAGLREMAGKAGKAVERGAELLGGSKAKLKNLAERAAHHEELSQIKGMAPGVRMKSYAQKVEGNKLRHRMHYENRFGTGKGNASMTFATPTGAQRAAAGDFSQESMRAGRHGKAARKIQEIAAKEKANVTKARVGAGAAVAGTAAAGVGAAHALKGKEPEKTSVASASSFDNILKIAAELQAGQREEIKGKNFAVHPEGGEAKYPIHDESHARNALTRVRQFGTPAEKAQVFAAVTKKYPALSTRSDVIPEKTQAKAEKKLGLPHGGESQEHEAPKQKLGMDLRVSYGDADKVRVKMNGGKTIHGENVSDAVHQLRGQLGLGSKKPGGAGKAGKIIGGAALAAGAGVGAYHLGKHLLNKKKEEKDEKSKESSALDELILQMRMEKVALSMGAASALGAGVGALGGALTGGAKEPGGQSHRLRNALVGAGLGAGVGAGGKALASHLGQVAPAAGKVEQAAAAPAAGAVTRAEHAVPAAVPSARRTPPRNPNRAAPPPSPTQEMMAQSLYPSGIVAPERTMGMPAMTSLASARTLPPDLIEAMKVADTWGRQMAQMEKSALPALGAITGALKGLAGKAMPFANKAVQAARANPAMATAALGAGVGAATSEKGHRLGGALKGGALGGAVGYAAPKVMGHMDMGHSLGGALKATGQEALTGVKGLGQRAASWAAPAAAKAQQSLPGIA